MSKERVAQSTFMAYLMAIAAPVLVLIVLPFCLAQENTTKQSKLSFVRSAEPGQNFRHDLKVRSDKVAVTLLAANNDICSKKPSILSTESPSLATYLKSLERWFGPSQIALAFLLVAILWLLKFRFTWRLSPLRPGRTRK